MLMTRIIIEKFPKKTKDTKKKLTTSPERQREKLNWNYEITEERTEKSMGRRRKQA